MLKAVIFVLVQKPFIWCCCSVRRSPWWWNTNGAKLMSVDISGCQNMSDTEIPLMLIFWYNLSKITKFCYVPFVMFVIVTLCNFYEKNQYNVAFQLTNGLNKAHHWPFARQPYWYETVGALLSMIQIEVMFCLV